MLHNDVFILSLYLSVYILFYRYPYRIQIIQTAEIVKRAEWFAV